MRNVKIHVESASARADLMNKVFRVKITASKEFQWTQMAKTREKFTFLLNAQCSGKILLKKLQKHWMSYHEKSLGQNHSLKRISIHKWNKCGLQVFEICTYDEWFWIIEISPAWIKYRACSINEFLLYCSTWWAMDSRGGK